MYKSSLYCKEFIDKSRYIFNWLNKQPAVGEESITDWMLFELSESLPSLKYRSFSRHKEARVTGADWEWWFVDNTKALCLRIQAKKLFSFKDNFNSLAYTNRYGLQIEKLINDAKVTNALPFYTFYYAPNSNPKVLCGGAIWNKEDCGVFISPAKQLYDDFVKGGKKKIVTDVDILAISNPMHCLVCCMHATSVDEVFQHISTYYKESISDKEGLHSSAPAYVQYLLKMEESEIPQSYEKEFEEQIKEINALVVVDMRQDDSLQMNK